LKTRPGSKNKTRSSRILYIILTVLVLLAAWLWWRNRGPRFVRYKEFGIEIPVNYSVHGIDVSRYQGIIDWQEVKAMNIRGISIRFVFIKATEGIGNTDPRFNRNWKKSREAGITRGAYHFFVAGKDGREQARNFIGAVGDLEPGDLPPVLDVERTNGVGDSALAREVQEWLDVVEDYYKITPIVYTYVDFYSNHLGDKFSKYPFWAAHYLQHDQPRTSRNWLFWQHSEKGHVNGINGFVDFNVFNGEEFEFSRLLVD
jgi:lysozyme